MSNGAMIGEPIAGWLWWLVVISPILLGAFIGVMKPAGLIRFVDDASNRIDTKYREEAARRGFFSRFIVGPLLWGVHQLHRTTDQIASISDRAGIRAMAFFYVAGFTLYLAYMAVVLVLTLVMIVVAIIVILLIAGMALGGSGSPQTNPTTRSISSKPQASRYAEEREQRPPPPPPIRHGHPSVVRSKAREHCACRHGCRTWAIITDWACGCVQVEVRDDESPGRDCTRFSERRWHCGEPGRPYTA